MTNAAKDEKSLQSPLGIVAGKGDLPERIAAACRGIGRDVFMLAIEGDTPPETVQDYPHAWINIGALGAGFAHFRQAGAEQIVMAGRVERPSLTSLRPDAKAAKLLAKLGPKLFSGDDRLLSTIISFLEEEGFEVVGVEDVLAEALTPEGPIGKTFPDRQAQADIEIGVRVAKEIGRLDIGQAVVVQQGHILGIEAMEGTDALINRCADLKVRERGGVLVKVKKPYQEQRVDLPTIGLQTVESVKQAGFSGIAVESGGSLIVDREAVARAADAAGIFIVGFTAADEAASQQEKG